uniref:GYF domain-containing protein n=1 Tax=Panagrellus redivivus TaxID=6233 RepID=A0A7E4ZZ40_PANRE
MKSLFFFLLLPVISLAKLQEPIKISTSPSPLDDDEETSTLVQFDLPFIVRLINLMPRDCSQSCNKKLMSSLKQALGSNSDMMSGYADICSEYAETMRCLDDCERCDSTPMFDALTSGIRYMCVDRRDAFEANLACVNEAIVDINRFCAEECEPEPVANRWKPTERSSEKVRDPTAAKISMSESCRIGKCVLGCFKSRLDSRCDGSIGTALTEVALKPLEFIHDYDVIPDTVALVFPAECVFLVNMLERVKNRKGLNLPDVTGYQTAVNCDNHDTGCNDRPTASPSHSEKAAGKPEDKPSVAKTAVQVVLILSLTISSAMTVQFSLNVARKEKQYAMYFAVILADSGATYAFYLIIGTDLGRMELAAFVMSVFTTLLSTTMGVLQLYTEESTTSLMFLLLHVVFSCAFNHCVYMKTDAWEALLTYLLVYACLIGSSCFAYRYYYQNYVKNGESTDKAELARLARTLWFYKTTSGVEHGPFEGCQMALWRQFGYIDSGVLCRTASTRFVAYGHLFYLHGQRCPFGPASFYAPPGLLRITAQPSVQLLHYN